VSVISLPWLAGAWVVVLDRLEIGLDGKRLGLGIAAAVYVIGVILFLIERHRRETKIQEIGRREAAKAIIIAIIDNLRKTTPYEMVLYETLEKRDSSYTPEFLDSLVDHYPLILAKRFRKADGKPLMDKL
jgi:hypothetical protein